MRVSVCHWTIIIMHSIVGVKKIWNRAKRWKQEVVTLALTLAKKKWLNILKKAGDEHECGALLELGEIRNATVLGVAVSLRFVALQDYSPWTRESASVLRGEELPLLLSLSKERLLHVPLYTFFWRRAFISLIYLKNCSMCYGLVWPPAWYSNTFDENRATAGI